MQYFILIPISSGASFCTIFHQFFKSQPFDAIEDHPHPYISTPTVYPSSSTRPNKLEFTAESGLLNEELNPFGKDEDEVLHNQPQEEDKEEEARPVSPIKIVPPCSINLNYGLTIMKLIDTQSKTPKKKMKHDEIPY